MRFGAGDLAALISRARCCERQLGADYGASRHVGSRIEPALLYDGQLRAGSSTIPRRRIIQVRGRLPDRESYLLALDQRRARRCSGGPSRGSNRRELRVARAASA
jgi:hypothetical protein